MGDQPTDIRRLSPDLELLLCLSRVRLSPTTLQSVNTLLPQIEDWTPLIETALDQAVAPLVCNHLIELEHELIPGEIREAAQIFLEENRQRNKRLVGELLAILAKLKTRGIAAAPFKGPMLAEQAYGNLALRRFRDLDFLIREADVDATLEALEELGYNTASNLSPAQDRAFRDYSGEYLFFHSSREVAIEPHWALAPGTLAIDLDYEALWSRTVPQTLGNAVVTGWQPEDTLLMVCVHGSKEMWTRLQWICDVAELVRITPNLDWTAFYRRAEAAGIRRMMNIGLLLAKNILDAPLPEDIHARIEEDKTAAQLAAQAETALFETRQAGETIYRINRFRMDMRERFGDRLRYVLRTISTPRIQHFETVRLPDALHFLYGPVKLAHDYAALPLWRLGKFVTSRRSEDG